MSGNAGAAGGGGLYGLGIFGAFVYYFQQADTFWEYVLSFIQGLFWPAWKYGLPSTVPGKQRRKGRLDY